MRDPSSKASLELLRKEGLLEQIVESPHICCESEDEDEEGEYIDNNDDLHDISGESDDPGADGWQDDLSPWQNQSIVEAIGTNTDCRQLWNTLNE